MLRKRTSILHLLLSIAAGSITTFVFFTIFPSMLRAQVIPSELSKLNYRIIGFSFPEKQKTTQYIVEIANGHFLENTGFNDHLQQTISSDKNKIIAEVPSFGSEYTWRVVYKSENKIVERSELYHFATGVIPKNIENTTRLRIRANTRKIKDAYILFDGTNAMYDMAGMPVWYLPETDSLNLEKDVKVSPSGTITFIKASNAYEINYSGRILWNLESRFGLASYGTSGSICHHELNKLSNGHYMALVSSLHDKIDRQENEKGRKKFFPSVNSSSLAEFDGEGNRVWSWESSNYVQQSGLNLLNRCSPQMRIDLHENAFYFREKDSTIYISMSGINRIVKIQYPSGKVLNEYGTLYPALPASPCDSFGKSALNKPKPANNALFSHQHSLLLSDSGFLYVYNNNLTPGLSGDLTNIGYPTVLKMKESGDTLEKVWEFGCESIVGVLAPGTGGNVVILSDSSLFVSMNAPYGNLFIIDSNKNILWSAVTEMLRPADNIWVEHARYRASIVSRELLERLIWNEM
jgi:hypothetical protein